MTEIIKQIVESLKLLRQSQMVSQQSVDIVNKRIDDLVKFAISAKQLAVQYTYDIELGKEIRKLILKENEKTIRSSRKIS